MYDVFLSHNRRDKPWVRTLYNFLIAKGLKVFFDEESVRPGENIVSAIEAGTEGSRHIVLILSAASLASDWVTLETQLALHGDPAGKAEKLIPVLVEKIKPENLKPAIRLRNYLDLSDAGARQGVLIKLLGALGLASVTPEELRPLLAGLDVRSEAQPLSVAGIGDVLDWGWDGVKLLKKFIELDYETLENLVATHEGSPEQWAPVFMNHPETWRMLVSGPQEIRGYWHFAPLFPNDVERARRGLLLDSEITANRVRLFELPGEYDIYFVLLCLHPRYRHPRHVRHLFRSILDVFKELTEHGIFVRDVVANAYTDAGESICRSFNLTELGKHSERGIVYGGSMRDILCSSFGALNPQLAEIYRNAAPL